MKKPFLTLCSIILLTTWTSVAHAAPGVALLPAEITLDGPAARQTLLVQRVDGSRLLGQVTEGLALSSSDPAVVKIEAGVAVPVANGRAHISVQSHGATAVAEVTVAGMGEAFEWSFRNHVQPVLAKFGCSSGACHGAAAGQNGFRLSLRGYDDEGDWRSLTRHALGRRIVPADPSSSLLVTKATGAVPHKGGVRFAPDSREYRVLGEWIAAGAPGPKADDARVQRIEILPNHVILKPGDAQQIVVRAHFDDGSAQDVTRWAKYTAADTSVATVEDATGKVSVVGHGEGAITAWYLSKIAIATVASPYATPVPPETFAAAPRRNLVDDLVLDKLKDLNLPPSPRCADEEFVRRAFLDTIGVLPTPDETRAFVADASGAKRDALIEALLQRPEFVDYWTYKWSDLLLVSSVAAKPGTMWAYSNWVRPRRPERAVGHPGPRGDHRPRQHVGERRGQLLRAARRPAREMSETVTLTFLGQSINCAQVPQPPDGEVDERPVLRHGQPLRPRPHQGRRRHRQEGRPGRVVFAADEGDLVQPLTGKPQPPRPLEGDAVPADATRDRREYLADWLCSPKNPAFARSIANRVWANFMGVGLVESVDDMRETNPPSNEKLMAALAAHVVEQKFDLKALMRLILQSETYQRSSKPLPGNAGDRRFYSRYYPRRMMAETLLDAFSQVTGVPTEFKNYPAGWRARRNCPTRTSSPTSSPPSAARCARPRASASGRKSRAWPRCSTSPTATR